MPLSGALKCCDGKLQTESAKWLLLRLLCFGFRLRFSTEVCRAVREDHYRDETRHKVCVCVCVCVIIWLPSLADYQLRLASVASPSPLTIISMPTNFEHPFECCKQAGRRGSAPGGQVLWWWWWLFIYHHHHHPLFSPTPHRILRFAWLEPLMLAGTHNTIQIAPGNVGDDTEEKKRPICVRSFIWRPIFCLTTRSICRC